MAAPTTIALIGPGAIGSTVAAWLAQSPALAVTLCARTPVARLAVETPDGPIAAAPAVLTDPAAARPVDWVLVCTKTYDAPGAAGWIERLLGPETRVAVLQNGVEHLARFAPWVPLERIVPAMVDIPAERDAPGRVRQRREGVIVVPAGVNGAAFVDLFRHTALRVSTSDDFTSVLWRKLAVNCAGAVSALTLKPHIVTRDPDIAELMYGLLAECVAVGRAEGAVLDDDTARRVVEGYQASPPDSVNSIHADRMAGGRMEWDARNGVIARLGETHGISAPLNRLVATILRAAEPGPA
ncbi:2-dehydropantoate 2-reductase [Sphingosinicella sp. LHD-64]|uniref:2-dehydropantoate 2-reductase n=1 Tax=Sphingosinicella sp. LHD-64 TaxID=3072139 RepID=UPI00280D8E48|nr:2-dehydropantoate 2-reductase [Sphingosinicella sp. LHD-64]MDQ8755935.1 2-dehydropantoate 2-reductase [Sphingosinicella sp. LHD-64]